MMTKVYVTRTFNCSKAELFKWMVEPERIGKWFGPKNIRVQNVETNLTVGGKYRIELLKPNGENFVIQGVYLKIEGPNTLVFSFTYQGISPSPPNSEVTISLETKNGHTQLSLVQTFETIPNDMDNRSKAWENMFALLDEKIIEA